MSWRTRKVCAIDQGALEEDDPLTCVCDVHVRRDDIKDDNRMLFLDFKMRLYGGGGSGLEDGVGQPGGISLSSSSPMVKATNGKAQPLRKLLTLSLKYVKDEAMAEINRSQPRAMSAYEIKWVVTGTGGWSHTCL